MPDDTRQFTHSEQHICPECGAYLPSGDEVSGPVPEHKCDVRDGQVLDALTEPIAWDKDATALLLMPVVSEITKEHFADRPYMHTPYLSRVVYVGDVREHLRRQRRLVEHWRKRAERAEAKWQDMARMIDEMIHDALHEKEPTDEH